MKFSSKTSSINIWIALGRIVLLIAAVVLFVFLSIFLKEKFWGSFWNIVLYAIMQLFNTLLFMFLCNVIYSKNRKQIFSKIDWAEALTLMLWTL